MEQKSERFEMRLEPATLRRVDDWRAAQPDLPSRAEAIRRLINSGLSKDERKFRPSSGEKLIIAMLCDLYRQLNVEEGGIDPALIDNAAVGRHHWALEWELQPMFEEPVDEAVALEVAHILDMWWTIEWSYDQLSKMDRASLEKDVGITKDRTLFQGFDGNEEFLHYDVAKLMIEGLRRFRHFENRDLNSHFPYLQNYRRMLAMYEPMKKSLEGRNHLTQEQIGDLIGAN